MTDEEIIKKYETALLDCDNRLIEVVFTYDFKQALNQARQDELDNILGKFYSDEFNDKLLSLIRQAASKISKNNDAVYTDCSMLVGKVCDEFEKLLSDEK